MTKKKIRRYTENDVYNLAINECIAEMGYCPIAYFQRKFKLSYDECLKVLKGVKKERINNFASR